MYNIEYDNVDLSCPPPENEPFRQQYFIAKCRNYARQKKLELGRPLQFSIQTFGCPIVRVKKTL